MVEDILWNVWGHSPECLGTFPRMFIDIPPIPRVPRIPLPVPVFLVLYIALLNIVDVNKVDVDRFLIDVM